MALEKLVKRGKKLTPEIINDGQSKASCAAPAHFAAICQLQQGMGLNRTFSCLCEERAEIHGSHARVHLTLHSHHCWTAYLGLMRGIF